MILQKPAASAALTWIKRGVTLAATLALFAAVCPAHAQGRSDMRWSGDVDDTTIITIRGNDVRTNTVFGKPASDINAQVFGYLPHEPLHAYLEYRHGRGQVRVIQQPRPDNDFTAKVRIHDPQPGRAHYEFDLAWAPDGPRRGGDGYFMRPPVRF